VDNLFEAIIGTPPASFHVNRQGGISLANGTNGQIGYVLQTQAGRIDLILTPPPVQTPSARLPLLPDLASALSTVAQNFSRGVSAIGAATRLALIINTMEHADSGEQANQFILQKIGFALPFSDGADLIFQINRRKAMSSMPTCELNRIMKWSGQVFQQINISGSGVGMPLSIDVAILSVDVNTISSSRTFSEADQLPIFSEMCAEADRLCQANDPAALQ
jgi:hypothetical protein